MENEKENEVIEFPILFNVFRVFVIPSGGQQIAQFDSFETKEDILNSHFFSLSNNPKNKISRRGILFSSPNNNTSSGIFKFQLGKEGKKTLHKEGDIKPETYTAPDLKLIDIIYYKKRQILLIEKSSSYKTLEASNLMTNYFQSRLRSFNLTFKIDTIPEVTDFWARVNDAKEIYELELDINQLNINEGNDHFREILMAIKQDVNDDSFNLKLKNAIGKLSVNNDKIKKVIEYISEVGGKFKMKSKHEIGQKKKDTFDSTDNIKKVTIYKKDNSLGDDDILTGINNIAK